VRTIIGAGPAAARRAERRALWRLAVPLIAANLSVAALGLTDTAVTGYLPEPHFLAGVALGGTVFNFLYWGLGFLRMGTAGLAAQACGAGDGTALRGVVVQALTLALALAFVIVALRGPIIALALEVAGASPAVSEQAARYFGIRVWAAPFTLSLYVLLGALVALQDGRGALIVLLAANALNVALDVLLVTLLGQGVAGVAAASVAADALGCGIGAWRVARGLGAWPGRLARAALLDRARARRLVAVNRDIFLRTLCLIFAFAFFNVQAGRMGDVALAASAVLMSVHLATAQVLDGLAFACEARVGRAVGAAAGDTLRTVVRVGLGDGIALGAAFALAYALAGSAMVAGLTDLAPVRALARELLPWLVLLPLVSAPAFLLDGVLIGATRTREMRTAMAAALVLVYLPAWWLTRAWGVHGLWAAFTAMSLARSVFMAAFLRAVVTRSVPPARP
jgi:multidrug resistance protein, MATE family